MNATVIPRLLLAGGLGFLAFFGLKHRGIAQYIELTAELES
jgi:hypothetical protein